MGDPPKNGDEVPIDKKYQLAHLTRKFREIDEAILAWDTLEPNVTKIAGLRSRLHHVKRQGLRLKLSFQDDTFYGGKDDHAVTLVAVNAFLASVETAEKFLDSSQIDAQAIGIRRLSLISTLCLPLGLVTGFFGMNFAFMGMEPGSTGVLRWRYAPLFLWTIVGSIVVAVQIAFKYKLL